MATDEHGFTRIGKMRIRDRVGHFSGMSLVDDSELTERVMGAVFEVANRLGCGFPEKVYERDAAEAARSRRGSMTRFSRCALGL
jgi:hypothetical protein